MYEEITLENLAEQIYFRKEAMRPRDERMDYDHMMYLLIDENQLAKEEGLIRFTGNEPRTITDLGVSVIARNPLKPHIAMEYEESDEGRAQIGLLERGIKGAYLDIDRGQNRRGLPPARTTAAWHLLLRGWTANRLVVRDEKHPLDYEPWDMRFTYPDFDRDGLASVFYESMVTWGDILRNYPEIAEDYRVTELYKIDLDQLVLQYEFWDRNQYAVAISAPEKRSRAGRPKQGPPELTWAQRPAEHGILDEEDDPYCPIIIVPAHGLPIQHTPEARVQRPILSSRDFAKRSQLPVWKKQGGWVADQGRSFLSSIEDSIPQFNEIVSVIWTIMDNDAYGTWLAKTRAGSPFEVALGGNAVNFMRIGEELGRVPGMAASPDTYNMLAFVTEQIKQGTADQGLLRGLMDFKGSGFLRAQMENAAVTSLGPWIQAYEIWATENAQSLLNQLRQGSGRQWTVWAEGSNRRLFKMDFGKETVAGQVYHIEVKSKPGLPDDLAVRVDIATRLANPARPLASIQTIFDKVLEWEDAEQEKKLLFDDLADMDPIVVMLRLQNRMYARGMPEIAEIFGEKAFAQAFVTRLMSQQMLQMGQQQQPTGRPESAEGTAGVSPEAAPPEQTGRA